MNRRDLMKLAPAALAVGAVPAAAEETPVMAMHREIIRLRDIVNDPGVTDGVSDAAYQELAKLANGIVDVPARDLGDMMLKFMGHTINGDHETGECPDSEKLWAEARALIGGAA